MTAMSTQPQFAPTLPQPPAQLRRWSAAGLLGLLALVALLVAWRRLAGALHAPLGPAALTLVRRGVGRRGGRRPLRPAAARMAPASFGGRTAAGLCPLAARQPTAGLLPFWAIVAGEEVWAWATVLRGGRRRPQPASEPCAALAQSIRRNGFRRRRPRWDCAHGDEPPGEKVEADTVPPAENVMQKLTLSQDADGSQRLSGWVRLRLEAGQRSGVVHVAFCPPFVQTPEWSLEQLDGPAARIRTAQLLPHGVRLEVKLAAAASDAASVLVRFTAWAAGGSART